MDKVRFGIIGMGNMGFAHLESFFKGKIKNAVVTAIADVKVERLQNAVEKLKGEYELFNSGDELLDKADIDAVLIAVPHYDHPRFAIKALNKGIHVLCEKPAGVYAKQVREMNEVALKSDKLFSLMYNQRTNPLYVKMHELISSGSLGELRRVNWIITNWFRTQFYYDSGAWRATWSGEGGGALMNQCPHQLDLLQWIVGDMPSKIRAFCHFGKWHNIETEDDVTSYMEFENGATGVFITSTADAPGANRFEVLCSKGRVICENDKLTIYRLKQDLQEHINTCKNGFSQPECEIETIEQDYSKNTQHAGIINNFANAILGLEELYVDGVEGIKCVELINAMLYSGWTDSTVSLPINEDRYYEELSKRIATSRLKDTEDILIDNSNSYGGTK
ncbi:MAG: Gfo/Idh/MocA family oxidoreductase [Clostridia bacterium]|nr:Gfo/Idh/MocA family oxidoreductase [Clostridia bacterium]